MGGYGSGLAWGAIARRTVEGCLTLDVNRLARAIGGMSRPASGRLDWPAGRAGGQDRAVGRTAGERADGADRAAAGALARIDFELERVGGVGPVLRLRYAVALADGARRRVSLPIRLTATRPLLGGVRWWFTCPLAIDGKPCNRRVGKLHLPAGAVYFGCRACHGLTYRSRRVQSPSTA